MLAAIGAIGIFGVIGNRYDAATLNTFAKRHRQDEREAPLEAVEAVGPVARFKNVPPDHLVRTTELGEQLVSVATETADDLAQALGSTPDPRDLSRTNAAERILSFLFLNVAGLIGAGYTEPQRERFMEEICTAAYQPFLRRLTPQASRLDVDSDIRERLLGVAGQFERTRTIDSAQLSLDAISLVVAEAFGLESGLGGTAAMATVTSKLKATTGAFDAQSVSAVVAELDPLVTDGDELGPRGQAIRTFVALTQGLTKDGWDRVNSVRTDLMLETDYSSEEREAVDPNDVRRRFEEFDRGELFTPEQAFYAMAQRAAWENRFKDAEETARMAMPAVTIKLVPLFANELGAGDRGDHILSIWAACGLAALPYLTPTQFGALYAGFDHVIPLPRLGLAWSERG